ncbi:MAG: hypothetical protein NC321_05820 [Clostridium sp.]|nr:hypothetical protein [Clostridium sp.]
MKTKRVQKLLCGISTLSVCCMLTGCHMSHEWQEATCTTPRTCSVGGETEGEALGHTWVDATCSEAKHCSVCGEIEGETLAHTWVDATCSAPKTCSVCGETEGKALEHTLTEANYQQPATCEVCGETVGEPLTAYFEENGLVCDAQLDTAYPYTVLCYNNNDYTTTGTVTISDYEVFSSDETHNAVEGYEWQTIMVTFVFDDENAQKYGLSSYLSPVDYYTDNLLLGEIFTINYNGIDYEECIGEYETLQSGWNDNIYTKQYRIFICVPNEYDGLVIRISTNTEADDTLYCRLPQ